MEWYAARRSMKARWTRGSRAARWPRNPDRMVRTAFPRCRVVEMQPLGDGLRNANFKLRLDGHPSRWSAHLRADASRARKGWTCFGWPAARSRAGGDSRGAVRAGGSAAVYPGGLCGRYRPRDLERSGDTEAAAQADIPREKLWRDWPHQVRPGRDGSVQGRPSRRRCWKGRTPRRDSWICVPRRATSKGAHAADLAPSRQRPVWRWAPELAVWMRARLVHRRLNEPQPAGTCLAGRGPLCRAQIGSSPFPALRWATWATSCATSAPRTLSRAAFFGRPTLHAGGALARDWWRLARVLDLAAVCEA